jgi:aminopeptidase YwaD
VSATRSLTLLLLATACASAPPLPPAPPLDPARIARDVAWLADDAREGRGAGSAGLAAAERYLAEGFRAAGLETEGADGAYAQRFEMPLAIRVVRESLRLNGAALRASSDFRALASSADASLEGELVFAGYGISAPHEGPGWDDYAGVDVAGRVVLVLDDRPGGRGGPLGGSRVSGFLRRSAKIANARRHGAAAFLLAPAAGAADPAPGEAVRAAADPNTPSSGIPALWLSRAAAERLVAAGGASLAELQSAIDASGRPAPALLPGVRVGVEVAIEREHGTAANVVAVRLGSDPRLTAEAVVIGAHYDHLGRGPLGSLAPDRSGEIHNGADDNASGAAGLLELARAFAAAPAPRRTLVLVAFAGEELGLAGSRAFATDPPLPVEIAAMLNLDMIGRLRDGRLSVFGSETSAGFPKLLERAARGLPVEIELAGSGYAPSDQTSFLARGVPVLFFFTGTHPEYHTPEDDAALVNAAGEAEVLRVVYRVSRALLDADPRPELAAEPAPPPAASGGPGYGPYLGTVPDFVPSEEPGVPLQAVRAGSPAERAGLRAGDRIVSFDGASVTTLEEFAALLFASRAGDTVEIVVVRSGARVVTRATLGRRR